jgi:DNA-binding GntR family transcriptional regulator
VTELADHGHALADVVEQVSARRPDFLEAQQLGMDPADPLIVLTRTGRDGDGIPVEYAVNLMVASRVEPLTYNPKVR